MYSEPARESGLGFTPWNPKIWQTNGTKFPKIAEKAINLHTFRVQGLGV